MVEFAVNLLAQYPEIVNFVLLLVLGYFIRDGVKAKRIAKEIADVVNELTTHTEGSGKIDSPETAKAISVKAETAAKNAAK